MPAMAAEQEARVWVPLSHAKADPETRDEINRALEAFGFANPAEGLRLVMKAFARSPGVRDAVRDALHLALLDAPGEVSR